VIILKGVEAIDRAARLLGPRLVTHCAASFTVSATVPICGGFAANSSKIRLKRLTVFQPWHRIAVDATALDSARYLSPLDCRPVARGSAGALDRGRGMAMAWYDRAGLRRHFAAAAALMLVAVSSPASALDGTKTDSNDPSPIEAFKAGTKAYKAGDMAGAQRALEFAASKGHAMAQWKLARMYSEGEGLPRDDLKAFEFYQAIVDAHGEDSPDTPQARFVSSALVALGSYYLNGIPNTRVRPDQGRAVEMFQYAAMYYGDSDAQYNLGRLYLDGGAERPRDTVTAARWLRLAADKGQRQAQAVLGHLLFSGDDMPRQAARGLMYLTLAKDGADDEGDKWIVDLYDGAFAKASTDERDMCLTYLEQFLKEHARQAQQ